MNKLAMLSFISFLATYANATHWIRIIGDDIGTIYVDIDSISKSNVSVIAFRKNRYHQVQIVYDRMKYNEAVSLEQFYCNTNPRKYRLLTSTAYLEGLGFSCINCQSRRI